MRIPAKVCKLTVPVAASIFLVASPLSAQVFVHVPGEPAGGLQMRLFVDRAETGQFRIPRFRVELRNVGDTDRLLDLGTMTPDGARQYPTAVSLILSDAQGKTQRLELRAPRQENSAARKTFLLPLPAGAAFSFLVDLRNYWTIASKQFDPALKPGTYSLMAQLNAFAETSVRDSLSATSTLRRSLSAEGYVLLVRTFDNASSEPGGVPTSNGVVFEIGR